MSIYFGMLNTEKRPGWRRAGTQIIMDFYPSEFSPSARDRVEKEKIRAYRDLLPASSYDIKQKDQDSVSKCVMRIFLAFAKEVCALQENANWTLDRIDRESLEFLRRLTITVVYDKAPSLDRSWISNWDGSLAPEVVRRFTELPEWRKYEDLKLAADAQQVEADREMAPKPAIDIDRAIASWKRMHGIDDEPQPSGQNENTSNGIPRDDVEVIEHGVWVSFFDEPRLPRPVEMQWQSVLSAKKAPDKDADLGLTFALTKEYVRAIARAVAKFADLLANAAISRRLKLSQQFRDALWRECLDFANGLAQWDAFANWVDKVTRVQWEEPLMADGRVDQDKLQAAVAERRKFFERKISMYSNEWLSAADGAIELQLTASGPEGVDVQNGDNTTQAGSKPESQQQKPLTQREAKIWEIIQQGLKGRAYCRELDAAKISPPRKGIWENAGARTYSTAYMSDKRLAHWIQDEKSKIRRKAELTDHTKTRAKLASE
jgi:hypothetical protein